MPVEIKSDPANGVAVAGKTVYYSLASPHWTNLNRSPFAPYTYHYSPRGGAWKDGEMATMNMANWNQRDWNSPCLALKVALGYGWYEQSIKVGKGGGVTAAFYLSEYDQNQNEPRDQLQEIDFEFSGSSAGEVQTNVWWQKQQRPRVSKLPPAVPGKKLDCREEWGFDVYRYRIDWEPDAVTWSVDTSGSGNHYQPIRTEDMARIGRYDESLCHVYISFWTGWTFDSSPFQNGGDATGNCGKEAGPCYQAFLFQSLKFTRSDRNNLVTLVG